MYDVQRVGSAIADIEKYITEIKTYGIQSVNDLSDSKTRHATAMLLFAILNRISDIGSEIISAEKLGAPTRYADVMQLLAKAGAINKEQAAELNELMEKRNVLAHFYGDITSNNLLALLKKLSSVEQFLKSVKKRVQKSEKKDIRPIAVD